MRKHPETIVTKSNVRRPETEVRAVPVYPGKGGTARTAGVKSTEIGSSASRSACRKIVIAITDRSIMMQHFSETPINIARLERVIPNCGLVS